MTDIQFKGSDFAINAGESLLDGLLRNGVDVNHGCKAGLCQACLLQSRKEMIPAIAQTGLTSQQKDAGYFLSCQCYPETTMQVSEPQSDNLRHPARVIHKEWLNHDVIRLRLDCELSFKAGQYVTLWNDKTGRCYSIASTPDEGWLECHIKVLQDGAFSQWIASELTVGDPLLVQGPMGLCYYEQVRNAPMLLAGTGTGLAPLYGVLKDALSVGHQAPIDLLVGANRKENFYLQNELGYLEKRHPHLSVHWVAKEERNPNLAGDIYRAVQDNWPSLESYRVFLAGAPGFVQKMKKICFLQGAGMRDISSDSFARFSLA